VLLNILPKMDLDLKQIFNKKILILFGILIALDLLSLVTFYLNFLSWPVFLVLTIVAGILTWKKLENGVYIMIMELIMGGFGYWFFIDLTGFRLPLRMAIFTVIMTVWLIKLILKTKEIESFKDKIINLKASFIDNPKIILLLFFAVFFILSIALGVIAGRSLKSIFLDSNNYLYLAAILLFLSVKIDVNKLLRVFFAGTYALALKTGIVLILLGHASGVFNSYLYTWIRDTRIGEMTAIFPPLYRVFFQSHVFSLATLLILLCLLFLTKTSLKEKIILGLSAWLNFWIILISGSRSFWLAMFFSCGLFFFYLIKKEFDKYIQLKRINRFLISLWQPFLLSIFLTSCLVAGQLFTNIILNNYQISLLFSRVSEEHNLSEGGNEAALNSRADQFLPLMNEIKKAPFWGQGFGKTVTYLSSDPRVKGLYTTSAFELAYLDKLLKFGLLGLFFYLMFIWKIIIDINNISLKYNYLYFGVLIIFALMLINLFTPYLNHPLGIGLILMVVGLTSKKSTDNFGSAS
jgi:hypothetical protein